MTAKVDLKVLVLILIPRLFGISRFFWKDEAISLQTLNVNIFQNPLFFGVTTNLPLFFYLLRIFELVAFQPWIYRLLPLLFSVAGGLFAFNFIKKEFGGITAWVFIFLYSFSPLQAYYATELRPYTLLQFLIILNLCYLYEIIKHKRGVWQFSAATALIVLTHYAGYFFLAAELVVLAAILALLWRRKFVDYYIQKPLQIVFLALIFGFLLSRYMLSNPSFMSSVMNLEVGTGWNPLSNPVGEITLFTTRVKEVVSFYYWYGIYYFSVDPIVQSIYKKFVVLVVLAAVAFFAYSKETTHRKEFFFLGTVFALSLTIAYLAEKFGYFPFGGRHIMPYSFMLFFLISLFLGKLAKFSKLALGAAVVLLLPVILFDYCTFYKLPSVVSLESIHGSIFETCL